MSHLDEGTIHALLDGEIPGAELAPIQAHLAGCAECRDRLAAERELLDDAGRLIDLIEAPPSPAEPAVSPARSRASRRNWPLNLAWAASLLAAAGLGYAARELRPGAPVASLPIVRQAPDSSIASPSPLAEPAGSPQSANRGRQAPAPAPRSAAAAAPAEVPADESRIARDADRAKAAESAAAPSREEVAAAGRLDRMRDRNVAEAVAAPVPEPKALASLRALPEVVTFPEALRRLDGTIRLIPGLLPIRLETLGGTVRVIYGTDHGDLVLAQELRDGRIVFTLIGPAGFPADSLERLRRSVRD